MEVTAAPHHSGPNESAIPTPPIPAVAAPRATITSSSPGSARLPALVLAVPPLLFPLCPKPRLPVPVKRQEPTGNEPAKGPQAPSAALKFPPTTTSTGGETMLPGESHERQDHDRETLCTEPTKKGKVIYGRLELNRPTFKFRILVAARIARDFH